MILTSQYAYQVYLVGDTVRMAAQVVSGIGFLASRTIVVTVKGKKKQNQEAMLSLINKLEGVEYIEFFITASQVKAEKRSITMWNRESRENIMIVGHRGVRNLYPENTMVSFRAALALRLDLIEFDVHFTKDRQLVVCHDLTIDRTTNGTGKIRDMTLEELQSYDAGIVMGEQFAGQYIPTLKEVLELMANADYEVLLNVEIKDYDHDVVDAAIAMLKQYGLDQRTVIACFNAEVIAYTQKAHPDMRTQGFPKRVMQKNTDAAFEITEKLYENMFGIGIPLTEDVELAKEDVAFANNHGLRPWLFCMDNEERTRIAVEIGATNVTCNDPTDTLRYLRLHGLRQEPPKKPLE